MGWNDLFHGVLNIILTFIDTLIQMKAKTQIGIAFIVILLLSITTISAIAESETDLGSSEQTQNRNLYRNHDGEMPGQHKEYDYHHYHGDDYN